MPIYFLKKWYFDILTPQNDYIFMYCAFAKFLRQTISVFNVFHCNLNSETKLHASVAVSFPRELTSTPELQSIEMSVGRITFSDVKVEIEMSSADFSCNLQFLGGSRYSGDTLIMPTSRTHRVLWRPLAVKSLVSGSMKLLGSDLHVHQAPGYVDYLYSNVFPLNAPVHILYWGRIHCDSLNLAYTIAYGPSARQQWIHLILQHEGNTFVLTDVSIENLEMEYSPELRFRFPREFVIHGRNNGIKVEIAVTHMKQAVQSVFTGEDQLDGKIKQRIIQYISKDPRGIKFFAEADIILDINGKQQKYDSVMFIDEYVEFATHWYS